MHRCGSVWQCALCYVAVRHYVMWQYVDRVAMWHYVVWQCANVALCLALLHYDLPGYRAKSTVSKDLIQPCSSTCIMDLGQPTESCPSIMIQL